MGEVRTIGFSRSNRCRCAHGTGQHHLTSLQPDTKLGQRVREPGNRVSRVSHHRCTSAGTTRFSIADERYVLVDRGQYPLGQPHAR